VLNTLALTIFPPYCLSRLRLLAVPVQDGLEAALLQGVQKGRALRLPGAYRHLLTSARNVHVAAGPGRWADMVSPAETIAAAAATDADAGGQGESSPFSARVDALWRSGEMGMLLDAAAAHGVDERTDVDVDVDVAGTGSAGQVCE